MPLPDHLPDVDRKAIFLSASLLFSVIATFVVLKSSRDALILSEYSARALPFFMAATAVAAALATVLQFRLYSSHRLGQAAVISFATFAIGTFLLWTAIRAGLSASIPFLYVWVGLFGTIAPIQAWSLITLRLLTRQARRSVGMIGAGAIGGAIAGGLLSRLIVQASSVPDLLAASALMMLLAALIAQALHRRDLKLAESASSVEGPPLHQRFLFLLMIVMGSGSVIGAFAEFQFKVMAQRELVSAERLAGFFGSFHALTGSGTLLFQILITPLLLQRVGVAPALLLLPLTLLLGNGALLASGALWAAVALKGGEQLFKHSVDRSSLEVLYTILPHGVRLRAKSLLEIVGVRTAEVLAGVLLIVLFSLSNFPVSAIAVAGIGLSSIWVAAAILLNREYPRMLKGAIRHKEIKISDASAALQTSDFYRILPDLLQTSDTETVLGVLDLVEATADRKLASCLEPLLRHDDHKVRLRALQLLFSQESDLSQAVEPLLRDSDRNVRIEAVHYLCVRSPAGPVEKLCQFLESSDPVVQVAASACSLNHEMETARLAGYARLKELLSLSLRRSQPEVRVEIAHVLEHVRPSASLAGLFETLLADPSQEVRKATLHTIARASNAGGQEALQVLMRAADTEDLALRYAVLKALNRAASREPIQRQTTLLETLLEREVGTLEMELRRAHDFSPRPKGLMDSVLRQRHSWATERMFRVLGLIYDSDSVYYSYLAITGRDRRRADFALELLDSLMSPDHRGRILRLLESKSSIPTKGRNRRKTVLLDYLREKQQLPVAAALAELTARELRAWAREIETMLESSQDMRLGLAGETLRWRRSEMKKTPLQNGDVPMSTIQKLEHLGKVDIFSRLGAHELWLLAEQSGEVQFEPDEQIFKEGEIAKEIFALIHGSVELRRTSGHVEVVRPGESFGTLAVLTEQPRLFSARALEHCRCLSLKREIFWEILEEYPAVSKSIFEVLVQHIHGLTEKGQDNLTIFSTSAGSRRKS